MRVDRELVARGLAPSRSRAQRWIADGRVEICHGDVWQPVTSPSQSCHEHDPMRVAAVAEEFVSRAGLKLAAAIDAAKLDVIGKVCIDIGASTGGFTDCLLQRGAAKVVCVDVGHKQLAPRLQLDKRVINFEGMNARELSPDFVGHSGGAGFDFVVMDVSFISQLKILPALLPLFSDGGVLVTLVKPQFELGRSALGKGGVVRDESLYAPLQEKMTAEMERLGLSVTHYLDSPIEGGDGNREFLLVARAEATSARPTPAQNS